MPYAILSQTVQTCREFGKGINILPIVKMPK